MKQTDFTIQSIPHENMDETFIAHWKNLEERCYEENIYLSPEFVLSSTQYLSSPSDLYTLAVYDNNTSQLLGLGLFIFCKRSQFCPFPHLIAFHSKHSYLSGLLLDKTQPKDIAQALFTGIKQVWRHIYAVQFNHITESFAQDILLEPSSKSNFKWYPGHSQQRAYLDITQLADKQWDEHLSRKDRQNYRRNLKKLEQLGEVSWKYIQGDDINEQHIETFLYLENKGWKGDSQSSLQVQEKDCQFFKSMMQELLRQKKVFFYELHLDDKVIASTCNFSCEHMGFAFKIGWDLDYAAYSPGVMNELLFLKYIQENIDTLTIQHIDSGADEKSFINRYWPERKTLVSGIYSLKTSSHLFNKLKEFKRKLSS